MNDNAKWLSVRDELPADSVSVLVYVPTHPNGYEVWIGYMDGETWLDISGEIILPTHWMPLPTPPNTLRNSSYAT